MKKIIVLMVAVLLCGCTPENLEVLYTPPIKQENNTENMALPENNITTTIVRNVIGATTNKVSELCTHSNINKWSRIKPIDDDFMTVTFTELKAEMEANVFGLSVPNFIPQQDQYWQYEKPGTSTPKRLGDFRGYYHAALPPMIIQDKDGTRNEAGYTGYLAFFAAINMAGSDEMIGIEDFASLIGYYLAADVWTAKVVGGTIDDPILEPDQRIGWTTGTNPSLTSIEFNFTTFPFSLHINGPLYFNFFLSSAAIPFTTTTPLVTMKALNADEDNKTQQYVNIVDQPVNMQFPQIEILGVRKLLDSGTWAAPSSVLEDISTYLETENSVAIRLKFNSFGNYSGATFNIRVKPTHINNATFEADIATMMYDLSYASISSIPLNQEFIIFGNLMNRDSAGLEYSTVQAGIENWVTFTLLGSYLGQFNQVKSFIKVITT